MRIIAIALLLASLLGYLYDEREGERRDALPALPALPGLPFPFGGWFFGAAAHSIGHSANPIFAPVNDFIPRIGGVEDVAYIENAVTLSGIDIDFSPAEANPNSHVEFGHSTLDGMTPQPQVTLISVEGLPDSEHVSGLLYLAEGEDSSLWENLNEYLVKAGKLIAVTVDMIIEFFKDLAAWVEREHEYIKRWMSKNPKKAISIGVVGVSITIVAAPGVVSGPLLKLVGFGSEGVIANSWAASVHSMIGNVASPSLFATLQSAGAGGYGLAMFNAPIQAAGHHLATACGVWDVLDDLVKEQMKM